MLIDLFFFVVGCWAIRELFSLGHHIACISYLCCLLSVIWSALFNQDWNHMNIIDWLIQLGLKFVRHNQGLNLSQKNRITLYKYCLIIILRKKGLLDGPKKFKITLLAKRIFVSQCKNFNQWKFFLKYYLFEWCSLWSCILLYLQ